jgi:hypothetical protein
MNTYIYTKKQNKHVLTYRIETKPNSTIWKDNCEGKGDRMTLKSYPPSTRSLTFILLLWASVDGSQSKQRKDNKSQ